MIEANELAVRRALEAAGVEHRRKRRKRWRLIAEASKKVLTKVCLSDVPLGTTQTERFLFIGEAGRTRPPSSHETPLTAK